MRSAHLRATTMGNPARHEESAQGSYEAGWLSLQTVKHFAGYAQQSSPRQQSRRDRNQDASKKVAVRRKLLCSAAAGSITHHHFLG